MLSVNATPEPQRTGQRNGVDLQFEAKFGKMGQPRQPKKNTKGTLQQEESLRLLNV